MHRKGASGESILAQLGMELKMLTVVLNPWRLALFRRFLVSAIMAGPFLLGSIYGFNIGNIPMWASLLVMFLLRGYFIFSDATRYQRNLPIT